MTTGDPNMQVANFSDVSTADDRGETESAQHVCDVDDQLARRRCAPCSVRQVALGAIVASHLYNEAGRSRSSSSRDDDDDDDDVSTDNVHAERRSLFV